MLYVLQILESRNEIFTHNVKKHKKRGEREESSKQQQWGDDSLLISLWILINFLKSFRLMQMSTMLPCFVQRQHNNLEKCKFRSISTSPGVDLSRSSLVFARLSQHRQKCEKLRFLHLHLRGCSLCHGVFFICISRILLLCYVSLHTRRHTTDNLK